MAARYLHVDVEIRQSPKHPHGPCGDVVAQHRTDLATDLIVCDGIGSGLRAYIAATMHVSRLTGLLREGFSLRQAFSSLVHTLQTWRDPSQPYAAVSLARIRHDGEATILTYDAPAPVLVGRDSTTVLPSRPLVIGQAVAQQSSCFLTAGEGLLLFSDGITQAGIGCGLAEGWTSEGVATYVGKWLSASRDPVSVAEAVHAEALRLDGNVGRDDLTAILAHCRQGQTLNIFTGPPPDRRTDEAVVRRFLALDGAKVVCGATTAAIVARALGRKLTMERVPTSLIAPPKYELQGVDLVTEGAVTLNQLRNLLDVPNDEFEEINPVTELAEMLDRADRVHWVLGRGANPANESLGFKQQGILRRDRIVPLLVDKLRARGKLVLTTEV